jgi:hypothetical protein
MIVVIRFLSSLVLLVMYIMEIISFDSIVWPIVYMVCEVFLSFAIIQHTRSFKQKITGDAAMPLF